MLLADAQFSNLDRVWKFAPRQRVGHNRLKLGDKCSQQSEGCLPLQCVLNEGLSKLGVSHYNINWCQLWDKLCLQRETQKHLIGHLSWPLTGPPAGPLAGSLALPLTWPLAGPLAWPLSWPLAELLAGPLAWPLAWPLDLLNNKNIEDLLSTEKQEHGDSNLRQVKAILLVYS